MDRRVYAYIASEVINGIHLMKVGKTVDLRQRAKQIKMPIERYLLCINEESALFIENATRHFILRQGGIQYLKKRDWFLFNERIYELLKQHYRKLRLANLRSAQSLSDINDPANQVSMSEDDEIYYYQVEYDKLCIRDLERELQVAQAALTAEREARIRLEAETKIMNKWIKWMEAEAYSMRMKL